MSGMFGDQKSESSYTGLLHYCTFGLEATNDAQMNDAQNVMVDTAHGKDNDHQNLLEMIM